MANSGLAFVESVLAEELDCLLWNHTNMSGPHIGKVTDHDAKREIARYRKALRIVRSTPQGHCS